MDRIRNDLRSKSKSPDGPLNLDPISSSLENLKVCPKVIDTSRPPYLTVPITDNLQSHLTFEPCKNNTPKTSDNYPRTPTSLEQGLLNTILMPDNLCLNAKQPPQLNTSQERTLKNEIKEFNTCPRIVQTQTPTPALGNSLNNSIYFIIYLIIFKLYFNI